MLQKAEMFSLFPTVQQNSSYSIQSHCHYPELSSVDEQYPQNTQRLLSMPQLLQGTISALTRRGPHIGGRRPCFPTTDTGRYRMGISFFFFRMQLYANTRHNIRHWTGSVSTHLRILFSVRKNQVACKPR